MGGRGRGRPIPSWMQHQGQGPGAGAPRGGVPPPPPPRGGAGPPGGMQGAPHAGMPRGAPQGMPMGAPPGGMMGGYGGYGAPAPRAWPQQQEQQPAPVAEAPKADATKCEWTEHTAPDGRKYYYNAGTAVSAWVKPPEFEAWEEAQRKAAESAVAASDELTCDWRECTADSGQKYYYNSKTKKSVWEVPPELVLFQEMKAKKESKAIVKSGGTSAKGGDKSSTIKIVTHTKTMDEAPKEDVSTAKKKNRSKEEAREAFRQLLTDNNIASGKTWDQVMPKIITDERYKLLRSLSEKKQIFSEYLVKRKQDERDEQRRAATRNRDNFLVMLEEVKAGPTMRYTTLETTCAEDPRLKALPDRDREKFFDEYVADVEKMEKEKARLDRREAQEAVRAKLELDVASGALDIKNTWTEVSEKLKDHPNFASLSPLDQLDLWKECADKIERDVMDARKRKDQLEYREERKRREQFAALLKQAKSDVDVHARTTWKQFVAWMKEDNSRVELYRAMAGQGGSSPMTLFNDLIDELDEALYQDVKTVKDMLKDVDLTVEATTTLEEYTTALEKDSHYEDVSSKNRELAYYELVLRAKYEDEADERRRKRREQREEEEERRRKLRDGSSSGGGSGDARDGERRRRHRKKDKDKKKRHRSKSKKKSKHKRHRASDASEDGEEPAAKRAKLDQSPGRSGSGGD